MKAVVQPFDDPALLDGINWLRVHSYPQFQETRDFEFGSSIYRWLKNHPLGDELHRWVSVADGRRVVGHLTAIPQYYRINGRRIVAHTPADFMVDPRHGFQAVSLMRRFFRATENYVSCDMVPAVIGVETRLGAEVAGQLSYAAKLLNVSRLPVPSLPAPLEGLLKVGKRGAPPARGYTSAQTEVPGAAPGTPPAVAEDDAELLPYRPRLPLPAPVKGLLNAGLRAADRALGAAFGGSGGLRVEELGGFDASFDELFERVAAGVPCVAEKDAAFLRWRYGPGSPQHPVSVLGVKGGETLLGYAVLMVTSSIDGYVLDLTTLPGRRDVARALLREATRFFRRGGVEIVRYRFLESPVSAQSGDLRRLGFFYRKGRSNTLLVRFSDHGIHKVARDVANWSYTTGDGEATFWMR